MNIFPPEPDREKSIHGDFSLENRIPQVPLPSAQPHPGIFWCRFFLRIAPGPTWYLLIGGILWLLRYDIDFIYLFLPAPLVAYGIGYCDAFLCESVGKENGLPVAKEALLHAFYFTISQIIIAPVSILAFAMLLFFAYR